jgi:thiosulfate dehydrogenase [quinone] large subunit
MSPTPINANAFERPQNVAVERKNDSWIALRYVGAGLRIVLGVIMLWAFADKLFGLGYATKAAAAWRNGGSPTNGFLGHTTGWLSGFFHAIAGNPFTDALFMAALLGIGLALVFGVGMRIAGVSGAALMLMMYAAATLGVAGTSNPVVDDHVVYALLFLGFAFYPAVGNTLGFGRAWQSLRVVRKHPILA